MVKHVTSYTDLDKIEAKMVEKLNNMFAKVKVWGDNNLS